MWRRMIISLRFITPLLIAWMALMPLATQAWFFSVAQAQSDQVVGTDNAQTVDLLVPSVAMASDHSAVDTEADITIDSGTALSPQIGSDGTLADVTGSSDSDAGSIQIYIVQPGDSVPKIASRFGISENTVRYANSMKKTDVVHVGDTLIILPVTGVQYTVKKGDTLALVEKKFKLTSQDDTSAFLDFNNLEQSDPLTIGQELIIPGAEMPTVVTLSKTATKSSGSKSTFVYKGSTAGIGSTALMIHTPIVSTIVRNYFIKPIPCALSQGKHDLYAVDLSCHTVGTPIKAAADGVVMFAKYGYNGGYGNLIIMKHPNGMLTFYAHIKADGLNVRQGQSVTQGQVIAYVGSTGQSTGPHLHFEVRGGGNPGFDASGSAWKK
ncbi:MAG: peptidase family protein [Patescibacteria group bacterium]|nr:peptidase family protein [Patescibacteria group bacterium]